MDKFTNLTAVFLSYSMSALSILNQLDPVALATGLAGAILTLTLAYKNYKDAKFIEAETHIKELEAEEIERNLNIKKQ